MISTFDAARPVVGAALATLLLLALPANHIEAAEFTVDSTADVVDANPGDAVCDDGSGRCTLRAAVQEANLSPQEDTVMVPPGTYKLSIPGQEENAAATGDLDLFEYLTIRGAGPDQTIVDGGGLDRVFEVVAADEAAAGRVTLTDLTVRNGNIASEVGGGIENTGLLTLERVVVMDNRALNGGGISQHHIWTELTAKDVAIIGNTAAQIGGGIWEDGRLSDVLLTNVTISGNTASNGGGVWIGPLSDTEAENTTISGNVALNSGGGVYLDRSEIVGLTHVTIADNKANEGGGIRNLALGSNPPTLRGSIVAGNSGVDCSSITISTFKSLGYNLDGDGTCELNAEGDLSRADPRLGPLAHKGGWTETHALTAGSPAIDAVSSGCPPPNEDQRALARPIDGNQDGVAACDIGAYEATEGTSAPPTPTPTMTPAELPGTGAEPPDARSPLLLLAIAGGFTGIAVGGAWFARGAMARWR